MRGQWVSLTAHPWRSTLVRTDVLVQEQVTMLTDAEIREAIRAEGLSIAPFEADCLQSAS